MDMLLWFLDLNLDPGHTDMLFGFIGGLFGKKPKKPKESENDKALAHISQGQFDRVSERFAPLTQRLDGLSQQDKSATLRGRGNADVMQAMGSARAPGANGQMASASRTGTRALGTALTGGTEQARNRSIGLTEGVMNAATGAGQEAIVGLGNATRMTTDRAIQKMQLDYADGQMGVNFLGSVAGGAAAVGMNRKPGATPMGARKSVFTRVDTGNGMRDPRTSFSGVGL